MNGNGVRKIAGGGVRTERRSAFCRPVVGLHALFHRPPSTAITRSALSEEGRREGESERICVCGRAKACINTRGEARITSYGR